MNSKIDLHMHSKISDGTDTVPELLEKIQNLGITTFAVTDHDAIESALQMERIVPAGLRFIRGVELSCKTEIAKCHILGYNYDAANSEFLTLLDEANGLRKNKLHRRLRYLEKEFGLTFSAHDIAWLESMRSAGKPHLEPLVRKQLKPALPGEEPVNIYETYFKHLPGARIDAIRAVKAVKAAGGIAVWAHPLGGTGEKRLTEEQFRAQLDLLCNAGIDALECYYSEYTKEEIETLCRVAGGKGLKISGGSDYHGTRKPHLHPGMLNKEDDIVAEDKLTVLELLGITGETLSAGLHEITK